MHFADISNDMKCWNTALTFSVYWHNT